MSRPTGIVSTGVRVRRRAQLAFTGEVQRRWFD
jgi:hypothetical protein